MDIQEMHKQFRVLGQQMGLQLISGILPESIDAFINDAIFAKVHAVLDLNSQKVFNDRQKSKIYMVDTNVSPINSLRTLYIKENAVLDETDNSYKLSDDTKVFVYTSIAVSYVSNGKYYKARIVDEDKLEDTLNDYCNRASKDYPIAFFFNDGESTKFDLYTDDFKPYVVEVRYIKQPNKVNYSNSINCDLPEYLHYEIVELAVVKFQQSLQSTKPVVANG